MRPSCSQLLFSWMLLVGAIALMGSFGHVGFLFALPLMAGVQRVRGEHDREALDRYKQNSTYMGLALFYYALVLVAAASAVIHHRHLLDMNFGLLTVIFFLPIMIGDHDWDDSGGPRGLSRAAQSIPLRSEDRGTSPMFADIVDQYATRKNYLESSLRAAIAVTQSTIVTVLSGHHLTSTRNIGHVFDRHSPAFDAKSCPRKARGAYRIELTSALVLILREVFERASCIDLGLRTTDDPAPRRRLDVAFPSTVGTKATYLKTSAKKTLSTPSWWQHMTPATIEWAHYMSLLGVWFIVNHEIAHIIRGHFTYLKRRGFTGELSELSFLDNRSPNFKHRFLEYDADNFAFDLMVWQAEARFGPLRKTNPDATSMVFQMYLAALLIFLLLDRNTPRLAFSDKASHPPLLARAAQLTQTLFDIFRDTDIPLHAVGAEVKRILTGCCRLALHLNIPNGRWRAGKLLGEEFEMSLDDRDSYLDILTELNEIADLRSALPIRQSRDGTAPTPHVGRR